MLASPRQQFRQNLLKVDIPNGKSSFNFLLTSCSATDLRKPSDEIERLTSIDNSYSVLETIGKGHQARVSKFQRFSKKEINLKEIEDRGELGRNFLNVKEGRIIFAKKKKILFIV